MSNTIYDFWLMIQQNVDKQRVAHNASVAPIQKIVMLTDFVESNKAKCDEYFPVNFGEILIFPKNNTSADIRRELQEYYAMPQNAMSDEVPCTVSHFCVRNCGVNPQEGYDIRTFEVTYNLAASDGSAAHSEKFTCSHYWFHQWLDHSSPQNIDAVLNLCLELMEKEDKMPRDSNHNSSAKSHFDFDFLIGSLPVSASVDEPLPVIHW